MFVPDADRDTWHAASLPEKIGEMLTRLGERHQLSHVVDIGELGLLGKERRLTQKHVILSHHCRVEQLLALLDEDIQQLSGIPCLSCVAEPVGQRCPDLLQGQTGNPLVQNLRHFRESDVGNLTSGLDENGAHRSAGKREGKKQSLRRELDQVQPLDDAVVEAWTEGHPQLLSDDSETLRGAPKYRLDRRASDCYSLAELIMLAERDGRQRKKRIDIHAVCDIGGNAAR